MKIGEKFKMPDHRDYDHFHQELKPDGTIVECVEDKGNGFYVIKLIDKCGKKIDKEIWGWLTKNMHNGDIN